MLVRTAQKTRAVLPVELFACAFHASASQLGSRPRTQAKFRQSTRRRLVKDLAPNNKGKGKGASGFVEYAPRIKAGGDKPTSNSAFRLERNQKPEPEARPPREPFTRDGAPHPEAKDVFANRSRERVRGSSRREARRNDGRDVERFPRSASRRTDARSPGPSNSNTDVPSSSRTTSIPPALRLSSRDQDLPRKPKVENPLVDEFDRTADTEPVKSLPSKFTSPPLLEGLLDSVTNVLGPHAKPTPIQGLAIKHLLSSTPQEGEQTWREYLLASETGSGKSLAYLLPMLQDLKQSEIEPYAQPRTKGKQRAINPRALVLAPTHELSRQLASTAKSLLHNIKLRVLCASRANTKSTPARNVTASKMAAMHPGGDGVAGEFDIMKKTTKPVDVLVGTQSKILEMVRGHGWNWDVRNKSNEDTWDEDEKDKKVHRDEFVVGTPEVGLQKVEWVIVDEADVLFDPDFRENTLLLLADVAAARGRPVPAVLTEKSSTPIVHKYPFNLILTSATIPVSLASFLDTHHPTLTRLASPNLHRLPSTLKTEHAKWTSGNRNADIEWRIKRIWHADTMHGSGKRSKVLIFCNRSTKVEELGRYLKEKGIPSVALTSTAHARRRGNNHHLDGFLRNTTSPYLSSASAESKTAGETSEKNEAKPDDEPHVLITTSLLSRGLDFAPEIENVLIVDAPRNMIDFLHRAGRTGRAGARGTVVIFGKSSGRGANKDKQVRQRVGALTV